MPDLIAPSLGKLRRAARRLVERDRPVILMYHWVARPAHDPWHLAVSPDRFAEQIEALVQFRHVVPLPWLVAQLAQGRVPRNAAVVTFDDGYADVLSAARPVLDIAGHPHGWRTGGKLATDEGRDGPIVVREQLHDELWRLLRPLDPESRSDLIIRLCAWVGAEVGTKSMRRPLSAEEVHRLGAPGFIDIGAASRKPSSIALISIASSSFSLLNSIAAIRSASNLER